MPKLITITPEKIIEVKQRLINNSIRGAARYTGVSFYTAWCIKEGKYETDEPLQPRTSFHNRCFITGFLTKER